jgi:rhamnosyltransferase
MRRCDESLNRLSEQVTVIKPTELTKKMCLTQTYNYGAATVFNGSAKNLICRHWPIINDLPHDLWAGVLCYWFGKIYYVDEELYYWIRYDSSVTGEGSKKSGIKYRLKETFKGKSYPNPTKTLFEYYGDLLKEDDLLFLNRLMNYKYNLKDKLSLIFDCDFKRISFGGTFVLKMGILFNKF